MRSILDELALRRPDLEAPAAAILEGRVLVNGSVVTNLRSRVRPGSSIVVREPPVLRGSAKLRAALDAFAVDPAGRVCLDLGAAAGGFTTVLLDRGAQRVYAVDVGHGQLRGSLRQDPRVVNLEATNVADLGPHLVAEPIELMTVDLSYLSLSAAIAQSNLIRFAPGADLVGLVKPMFELRLPIAPTDPSRLDEAIRKAAEGVLAAGWVVVGAIGGIRGSKGAIEGFVHARHDDLSESG